MTSRSPETLIPEITGGRWLIVADTLEEDRPHAAKSFAGWLAFFSLLAVHRRSVGVFALGAAMLALLISLLIPNSYVATTRLMPPQQGQSAVSAFLGQFGDLASLAGKDAVRNPSAIFLALLRSQTVSDGVIARFDLMKIYGEKRLSDCRERLEKRTQMEAGKEGVITIQVEDREPHRAAALANAYVEELVHLNQKLAVGEAAQRRSFFETQLRETQEQLVRAEDSFKQAQETTGMIQLEAQAKAAIESRTVLRNHLLMQEAETERIRTYAGPKRSDLLRAEQELEILRKKLRQAEQAGSTETFAGKPVAGLPAAGLEYVRRLREVKYQEAIFEMLARQLEAAKVDEAREGALIQVIDPAHVPDRKSGPHRSLITLAGAAAGFAASLGWLAGRRAWRSAGGDVLTVQSLAHSENSATVSCSANGNSAS